MIEVIYREDVSEDSIHEPRNVKQVGSVDPKYRIYMEETVLECIRRRPAAENEEVYFGLLLGELKRAAGVTYLFISGMVRVRRSAEKGAEENAGNDFEKDAENGFVKDYENGIKKDAGSVAEKDAGGVAERKRGVDPGKAAPPKIEFDGEVWSGLYEEINHYFPNTEILGWYASFPFLNAAALDLCRQIQYTHFSGADKVLFLCDRTEREEKFYRPDGVELQETEGYFSFFEKNDAMLAYQQEREPESARGETPPEEQPKKTLRQGTVGEAPRRKWNISAASVFVTAALLAAVLMLSYYNGRIRSGNAASVAESSKETTSQAAALAVDGQVSDPEADSPDAEDSDEDANNPDADGTDDDGEEADSPDTDGSGGDGESTDGDDDDSENAEGSDGDGENSTGSGEESGAAQETAAAEGEVSVRYYTVKQGETLYSICMDVYKTAAMVEIVRELNGIGEDYIIQEGQKIILP